MTLSFRAARPDDAEFLGWAMVMAARGHRSRGWFDVVLQRPEDFCIEFCAKLSNAQAKSWWHHSFFTIAELDGEVAAAACIFPDETPYAVSGQAMAEAARQTAISEGDQAQLWPRGAFILTATSGEDDCWTIENVATRTAFRGRGIAASLIRHLLIVMKRDRPPRAQISFLIGNAPAEKCYRGCGFAFAEDKVTKEFEAAMGVAGLRRLARAL